MNFAEAMQQRYTTKNYDGSKKVDQEDVNRLKEILRLSPSSINSQPWRFTFVGEGKVKDALAEVSLTNREKVQRASHVIVFGVMNSVELFEKHMAAHLPERVTAYYNRFIKPLSDEQIIAWMSHQVYLALGVLLSACAQMGIDSTPMEGIEREQYDAVLQYDHYQTLFGVAIGYRDQEDFNQPGLKPKSRLPIDEVIKTF